MNTTEACRQKKHYRVKGLNDGVKADHIGKALEPRGPHPQGGEALDQVRLIIAVHGPERRPHQHAWTPLRFAALHFFMCF